jgi:hypothetical protein
MLPNAPLTDLLTAPLTLDAGLLTPPNPLDVGLSSDLSRSAMIVDPMTSGQSQTIVSSPITRVPLSVLARFGLHDPNPRPIEPGFPPNWQVIGLPRAVPTPTAAVSFRAVPTPTAAISPSL